MNATIDRLESELRALTAELARTAAVEGATDTGPDGLPVDYPAFNAHAAAKEALAAKNAEIEKARTAYWSARLQGVVR